MTMRQVVDKFISKIIENIINNIGSNYAQIRVQILFLQNFVVRFKKSGFDEFEF
jgi:hypothetical protein